MKQTALHISYIDNWLLKRVWINSPEYVRKKLLTLPSNIVADKPLKWATSTSASETALIAFRGIKKSIT